MLERKINNGEVYRHFKGSFHKINAIAKDSDTLEEKVVYNHIDTGEVWVRDKSEFLSLVDKDKYPDVKQKYRFEKVK